MERHDGQLHSRNYDAWTDGFEDALTGAYARYGVPLFVSETSTHGDDDRRSAWLRDSVAAVQTVQGQGVPVAGYTWWPLIDLVDWSYGAGDYVVEDFVAHLGYPPQGVRAGGTVAFARNMEWESARSYPIERYLRRMGLWSLDGHVDGNGFARNETAAARAMRALIQHRSALGAADGEGTPMVADTL
jgi:hypothetical protein